MCAIAEEEPVVERDSELVPTLRVYVFDVNIWKPWHHNGGETLGSVGLALTEEIPRVVNRRVEHVDRIASVLRIHPFLVHLRASSAVGRGDIDIEKVKDGIIQTLEEGSHPHQEGDS